MQIIFNRRETGRLLAALRERLKKFERGVERHGDEFDPVQGANLLEAIRDTKALIHKITATQQDQP